MINRILLLLVCLVGPLLVYADTSTFLIRVVGGEDPVPPSTPTMLSVTPVASSQIDVVWSTSTDDVYLAGYVLLRDAVPIATTTLTSFNDTGLLPETEYTYSVYAFDGFDNVSTTSSPQATTTLAVPVTPVATSTTASESTQTFILKRFDIKSGLNFATLNWETTKPGRYELRWGRTTSYEIGYLISDVYKQTQTLTLTDFEPGTKYNYELVLYDALGTTVKKAGVFTTDSQINNSVPNVNNLKATTLSNGDVSLSYDVPSSIEDLAVRIVRSRFGYPRDPNDGAIIYDGFAGMYVDTTAFASSEVEYYTVFSRAIDGTYSSGAVTAAYAVPRVPTLPVDEDGETLTPSLDPDIKTDKFVFNPSDLIFVVDSERQSFDSANLEIPSGVNFLVSLPVASTPDTLKSIVLSFLDADLKLSGAYLLRINKDGSAYEAVIDSANFRGDYVVKLEVFDFDRSVVGRYQREMVFTDETTPAQAEPVNRFVATAKNIIPTIVLMAVVAGLMIRWIFFRREAEDKE